MMYRSQISYRLLLFASRHAHNLSTSLSYELPKVRQYEVSLISTKDIFASSLFTFLLRIIAVKWHPLIARKQPTSSTRNSLKAPNSVVAAAAYRASHHQHKYHFSQMPLMHPSISNGPASSLPMRVHQSHTIKPTGFRMLPITSNSPK